MKFDLSEDQALLRDATRDFLAAEAPVELSRKMSDTNPEGFSRQVWAKLAELGYLGLLAPGSAGGQGLGPIELAVVCEEMGRVALAGPYLDVVLAAKVLEAAGCTDAVREIASGQAIAVIADCDRVWPTQQSDVSFEGGRVRGTKFFVPFGAVADRLVATTPAGVVLVDGPFEARPMETLDEAQRFAEIRLDHPAELLGGQELVDCVADLDRVATAAFALGVAERALELAVDYSKERYTFGRPIGSYQALQHRMADMLLGAESSRSTVYRAAWALATDQEDAHLLAACAKAAAVAAATHNTREALQFHGGNGFTWEYDIHYYLKRAVTLEARCGGPEQAYEDALEAL
ncbi:MAG: acyl-CoA dehydrogenase [Candidatus Dadabacteria bacterium]|nr:MAG: acyl-CoA dehydrogenase [Candidatus Dadabacteria bacterium]